MYPQSLSPVQQVDFALLLIFVFSAAMLVLLTGATLYFLWRYNHKRNPVPTDIRGNMKVEVAWTVIPFLMVMGLFYFGWTGYQALRTVPPGAMEVNVTARMFSWNFTYANNKTSSVLNVPVGKPVKLNLRTLDVIHSLFIPAFRIKMDTVPGMATYAWFKTDRAGDYDIYCAEYCGVKHSAMLSSVKAMPQADFDAWYNAEDAGHGSEAGRNLAEQQGCLGCHTPDGAMAPHLAGLYKTKVIIIEDGKEKTVAADEAYLKESITDPAKQIVKGYDNTMPPYQDFTPEQLDDLIEYLRSIQGSPSGNGPNGHENHGKH